MYLNMQFQSKKPQCTYLYNMQYLYVNAYTFVKAAWFTRTVARKTFLFPMIPIPLLCLERLLAALGCGPGI